MAHAFPFWLARLIFPTRPVVHASPEEREPLKVEVECLPDYQWRELGFPQPTRSRRQ